ncbi:MAG: preprotein translocase subunit SecG [Bacteriovoracaceae bacterium]|jgi:preprotein translocase subunit SecG|nr:preprotein translocase subunit SecG [Bacteriovoracaceae bacterium]
MLTGLIIFHVVVCILLTITVLVQFGKGAEAGAMMGGGASQAVFTSSAKGNFFTKLTTFLAIAFMVNSVILTTIQSSTSSESVFDGEAPIAAPLNSDATEAPKTQATTQKAPETKKK